MCRDNEYCCLGVLCEVLDFKKSVINGIVDFYNGDIKISAYQFPDSNIINPLGKFVGFKILYNNSQFSELAEMNDEGVSFEVLAKIIEKYF